VPVAGGAGREVGVFMVGLVASALGVSPGSQCPFEKALIGRSEHGKCSKCS